MIRRRSNGDGALDEVDRRGAVSSIRFAANARASSWSSRRSAKSADSESDASRRRRRAFFCEQDFARTGRQGRHLGELGPLLGLDDDPLALPDRRPRRRRRRVIFPSSRRRGGPRRSCRRGSRGCRGSRWSSSRTFDCHASGPAQVKPAPAPGRPLEPQPSPVVPLPRQDRRAEDPGVVAERRADDPDVGEVGEEGVAVRRDADLLDVALADVLRDAAAEDEEVGREDVPERRDRDPDGPRRARDRPLDEGVAGRERLAQVRALEPPVLLEDRPGDRGPSPPSRSGGA